MTQLSTPPPGEISPAVPAAPARAPFALQPYNVDSQPDEPQLFDVYAAAVRILAGEDVAALQPALRAFELLLLREIGLLPTLDAQTATLAPLQPQERYVLRPEGGLVEGRDDEARGSLTGAQWQALQAALDAPAPFHATLLQALYSSVGLRSIQALVNSGSSYTLPEIPMVTSVNHVITYLPQFNRFVDSTDPDMPFDSLGFSVSDKPVLLVEEYRDGLRTPASQWQDHWQKAQSTVAINADGSASGRLSVQLAGSPAIQARAIWRQLTQQQEKDWLDKQFSSKSRKGLATIERDDPKPLQSRYRYSIDFEAPELIPSEGAGGMYVHTLGFSPLPVMAFAGIDTETEVDYDSACSNGSTSEEIRYTFPDNIRILAVPENLSLDENHLVYDASFTLDGNTLLVRRELQDKTPGNVCSAALANEQRKSLKKIGKNLMSQVVFQYL